MSELLHPGQHPDADQLSAFAEHVLPEHERLETLAHLAECPDCRQIVFLAEGAQEGPTSVEPARPGRAGWLRSLRYRWPAAAALACGLLIFAFQQRRRPANAPQEPAFVLESGSAIPPSSAQLPQPIFPAPPPSAKPSSTAKAGSSLHPASVTPRVNAEIGSVNGNLSAAGRASNLSVLNRNATTIDQKSTASLSPESAPVGGVFGASVASAAPSQGQKENLLTARQGQPTVTQTQNQLFPRPAAAPPALSDSVHGEIQQSSNQTVSVESAPLVLQTESAVLSATTFSGKNALAKTAKAPLPSKLPAASTISNGIETLAVDSAGDLFVSKDAGVRWQRVAHQWTGRAIKVSLVPAPAAATTQPAPSKPESVDASSSTRSETVGPNTVAKGVGFELVTDSGAILSSPDGFVWKQR